MPRGRPRVLGSPLPPGDVCEPYERFKYFELRNEMVRRRLGFVGRGVGAVSTKAGFMRVLREGDKNLADAATAGAPASESQAPTPEPTATAKATAKPTTPVKSPATSKLGAVGRRGAAAAAAVAPATTDASSSAARAPQKAVRAPRPRRGCRFRLINVLLSPDFNTRWGEMVSRGANNTLEVTAFWLDVHVAFNQQNSVFDALHFQDTLFVNVEPNVILKHSAARLLQMWVEVVGMYRTAVRRAKQATDTGNTSQSFFDFCAGRLDLLYLHMALLLDSELFKFVMSDSIPGSDTMPVAKIKVVDRTAGKESRSPATKPSSRKDSIGNKKEAIAGTEEAAANNVAVGSTGKAHESAATLKGSTAPRFHSSVSTAITPARPSTELMLPPDEWDILENRLRKTNENIDRCHRALTGLEANMSDSYRQTLEADLRFFSAIKQRLQEQLLVVMQSGY